MGELNDFGVQSQTVVSEAAILDGVRAAVSAGPDGGTAVAAWLAGSDPCWLAWNPSSDTLVGASLGGRRLADREGWLKVDHPFRARVRLLGRRLAALSRAREGRRGPVLERVRVAQPATAGPVLVAFQVIADAGDDLVLTVIDPAWPGLARHSAGERRPGKAPATAATGRNDVVEPTDILDEGCTEVPPGTAPAPIRRSRFVWHTDRQGGMGPRSGPAVDGLAAPVERPWDDVVSSAAAAAAMAERRAFSGVAANWNVISTTAALPVLLSGAPSVIDGAFAGFRGFALYDPGDLARIVEEFQRAPESPSAADKPEITAIREQGETPETTREDEGDRQGHSADDREPVQVPVPQLGLLPVFQALIDASFSGFSDLIDSIPRARHGRRDTGDQPVARPGFTQHTTQDPAQTTSGEPSQEPAPDSAADIVPANPETSERVSESFSRLSTQVGGTLGAPPPLLSAVTDSSSAHPHPSTSTEPPPAAAPLPVQDGEKPALTSAERGALSEIARALGGGLDDEPAPGDAAGEPAPRESATVLTMLSARARDGDVRRLIGQLRLAALVHARGQPVFANDRFHEITGVDDLSAVPEAAWAAELMRSGEDEAAAEAIQAGARPRRLELPGGTAEAVSAPVDWAGRRACLTLMWRPHESGMPALAESLELELARRDERVADLQAFLDVAGDGVVKLDGSGRIVAMTRAAETMFGHAENEITGEQISVLFAPESRADAFALAERARVGTEVSPPPRPLRAVRRDGAPLDLGATARRIGPPSEGSVVVALADRSGERLVEDSLAQAKHDLVSAHRMSAEVLARVSHDIRSPLTAIIGFADLLLEERLGPLQDTRLRPYLEGIRSSGLGVIDRVNQFSRYTDALAGRTGLAPDTHDLNGLIMRAVTEVQPTLVRQRVVLRTSFARDLAPVWIDETSILQAVVHLLSGVVALTPSGGHIIVSTASDATRTGFSVRAKDCQMSEQDLEAAVEPFGTQRDLLASPPTGLDLALAKALFGINHCQLTSTSSSADGILFEIILPSDEMAVSPQRRHLVQH